MAFFWLLHSLDDRLIDPEADGDREKSQDEVRNHTDDAERCQGKQHDQRGAKDKAGLLHVSPENQIVHCQEKREHVTRTPTGHGPGAPRPRPAERHQGMQLAVRPSSRGLMSENHIIPQVMIHFAESSSGFWAGL